MAQRDVYEWLKYRREIGDNTYYHPEEIKKNLRIHNIPNRHLDVINGDIIRLFVSGYLEMVDLDKSGFSNNKKVYRIKMEYCNGKFSERNNDCPKA
jgi:hypothetical protein